MQHSYLVWNKFSSATAVNLLTEQQHIYERVLYDLMHTT